ncbi:hypothetical protein GW17_00059970 [Ensete ventricosum]|nr:hypothetical protein GW17_00059970 [Ensete ventricosum]
MSPIAYCQGLYRLAAGLPIDPPEVRSALDARLTWLNRDVVEVGVWCSSVGGLTTIGPIILSPCRNPFRHVFTRCTYKGL